MWIGLVLTYLLLLRASELFAEENGVFHELYCLRRGTRRFSVGRSSWEEGEERDGQGAIQVKMVGKGRGKKGVELVRTRTGRAGGRASGKKGEVVELGGVVRGVQGGGDARGSTAHDVLKDY